MGWKWRDTLSVFPYTAPIMAATGQSTLVGEHSNDDNSGVSDVKDVIFGKEDKGTPDKIIPLDATLQDVTDKARGQQLKGVGLLGGQLDKWGGINTAGLASAMGAQQESQLRGGARDQIRQAGDQLAQRGLGNSSLGMRAELGATRGLADSIRGVRANIPMQELALDQQKNQGLAQASGGINSILQAPGGQSTLIPGMAATGLRDGGIWGTVAPVAGAVIGTMYGGPAGGAAGMQIGQGLGQLGRQA